jgi:hypothetical protein
MGEVYSGKGQPACQSGARDYEIGRTSDLTHSRRNTAGPTQSGSSTVAQPSSERKAARRFSVDGRKAGVTAIVFLAAGGREPVFQGKHSRIRPLP